MPSDIPYKDFEKIFKSYGVEFRQGKGSHFVMKRKAGETTYIFTSYIRKGTVPYQHVKKARRILRLMPENGVSDDNFNSK